MVIVGTLNAVWSHFYDLQCFVICSLIYNTNSTKIVFVKSFDEEWDNLIRCCIGGHIPIFWFSANKKVPGAASHQVGFIARFLEGFDHMYNLFWYHIFFYGHHGSLFLIKMRLCCYIKA